MRAADVDIRCAKRSTCRRIGCKVVICALLTVAAGHAAASVTVTTSHPSTVTVSYVLEAPDANGRSCKEIPTAVLRMRLRQLTGGSGLLIRVFLDDSGAVAAGSTGKSAYVGTVALAPSDMPTVQEFVLPLPQPIPSPWPTRATIEPAFMAGAAEPPASVSIEDVSLVRAAC